MKTFTALNGTLSCVLCVFLTSKPAFCQELWHGLHYGDDKSAVIRLFPDAKVESLGASTYLTVDGFGAESCPLSVIFEFRGSLMLLNKITVSTHANFIKENHKIADQCANKILVELLEKYKYPIIDGYYKEKDWRSIVWRQSSGAYITYKYLKYAAVNIIYSIDCPKDIIGNRDQKSAL